MKPMRSLYLVILLAFTGFLSGQNVLVSASVSRDTVLVNTPFEIRFTIENGQGTWQLPEFWGMDVLSGPNRSSQIQIINGAMSQRRTDTYIVQAAATGDHVIERATIEVDGQLYETEPVIVYVTDDPSLVSPVRQENSLSWFGNMRPDSDRVQKNSKAAVLKKYPKKKF